jgi:biotin transport system substrate-specific component
MIRDSGIFDPRERIRGMVYAALFSSIIAGSSIFIIPIGPVPITLQVLFVLLSGGLLGPIWGLVSIFIYLLMGIAGLPVFSGGRSGLGHIIGPTGGYLIGFLISSPIVGLIISSRRELLTTFIGMIAGLSVIYLFGILWLSISSRLTIYKAMAIGLIPFLPFDILKAIVASIVVSKTGRVIKGNR